MSILENKQSILSRKVWNVETLSPDFANLNVNGSVPREIQNKIPEGVLIPTDYIDSGKRTFLFKKNSIISQLKIEE